MQENSSNLIPSLQGIDALEVEGAVSKVNDIIYNIRLESLEELKNIFRARARIVCSKVGVIANKKEFKEHTGKGKFKMTLQDSATIKSKTGIRAIEKHQT